MDKWHNKVAVVTGASAGIGAACCKALIDNGMIVVGLARRPEMIEEMRMQVWPNDEEKRARLHARKCDVRQEADIIETFEGIVKNYGPVAVLINNAGVLHDTELIRENNTEELRAIVDTNIMGVALCTREAFKSMSKDPKRMGHVILINSVAGHKVLSIEGASTNMYPASKHAISAMTEVYRQEFLLYKTKIKVTSISPGVVRTNIFSERALALMEGFPMLEVSDIADAVIYCLQTPPHVQIHEMIIKPVGEKF